MEENWAERGGAHPKFVYAYPPLLLFLCYFLSLLFSLNNISLQPFWQQKRKTSRPLTTTTTARNTTSTRLTSTRRALTRDRTATSRRNPPSLCGGAGGDEASPRGSSCSDEAPSSCCLWEFWLQGSC